MIVELGEVMGIMKTKMFKSVFNKLKRREKTKIITDCVLHHILINGNGTKIGLPEINVNIGKNKSNLRIDVLQIHKQKDELIGYEVKSCIADFRTDNKWDNYLGLVNYLYFIIDEDTYKQHEVEILAKIDNKCGLYLYNCERDWISVKFHSPYYESNNPENIYQVMLFNYLLRTQIKN